MIPKVVIPTETKRVCKKQKKSLHLPRTHPPSPIMRHEYPWAPPTRLTPVPDKWVRPTRRPADLLVDPTDLVGGPHDLLKTFQKISQTT
jgi:hypothetical protein